MYSPELLLRLYAALPLDAFRAAVILGVLVSVLSLGVLGGLLRHLTGAFPSERKPWGVDIALGLTATAAWFVVRSALGNLFPFLPPVLEQEATLLTLAATFAFRRDAARAAFAEMRGTESLAGLFALVVSLFAFGYWRIFELLPASSDPGFIAAIIEPLREAGRLRFSLSDFNTNAHSYPSGILLLSWAFANPLISTTTVVHLWPHVAVTLLTFVVYDSFTRTWTPARRLYLATLATVIVARVMIGSFDVSVDAKYLEGVSKRSVGFLIALGLSMGGTAFATRQRATSAASALYAFTSLWSLALVALVNPINAYIAAAASVVTAVAAACGGLLRRRSTWIGMGAAAAVLVSALLQDVMVMQMAGPGGPTCMVFEDAAPYCRWTDEQREQAKVAALHVAPPKASKGGWERHLPPFLNDPSRIVYPGTPWAFHDGSSAGLALAFFAAIVAAALAASSWRRTHALRPATYVPVAGAAMCIVTPLVAWLQTYVLATKAGPDRVWLISGYTEQSLLNVWTLAIYALFVGLLLYVLRVIGSDRRAFAFLMATLLALATAHANLVRALWVRSEIHSPFGSKSRTLADALSQLSEQLPAGEALILPSILFKAGPETWNFPTGMGIAMHLYLRRPVLFSYSGQWPLGSVSVFDHFRLECDPRRACTYLREQGGAWLVDFGGEETICATPIDIYVRTLGCFERRFEIWSSDRKTHAVAYRLTPAG